MFVGFGDIGVERRSMLFGKMTMVWMPFVGECFEEVLISGKAADRRAMFMWGRSPFMLMSASAKAAIHRSG